MHWTKKQNHHFLKGSARFHQRWIKEYRTPLNREKRNETMGRAIVPGVDDPVVVAHKEKMQTEEANQIYRQRRRESSKPERGS
jgi:hypothetical protein